MLEMTGSRKLRRISSQERQSTKVESEVWKVVARTWAWLPFSSSTSVTKIQVPPQMAADEVDHLHASLDDEVLDGRSMN
jgi:hypothetical protein